MTLQFALFAQGVTIDRLTDRLSIFNVYEQITAPRFPVYVPELSLVVLLRREVDEPNAFDTVISIHLGENIIGQANMHVDFQGQLMNRNISTFQGLPILTPGELRVNFNLPNNVPVSATVPVRLVPEQMPAPQQVVANG
jgi:hypothetical protein